MKKFSQIFPLLKNHIRKFRFRTFILYVLLALLLLVPSLLARICQQAVDYQTNEFSVTIYEKDGTTIATEEGLVESAARYSLLESFYKIHTNKKEVAYAPGDPSVDHYISATLDLNGTVSSFKCYFSLDGTSDYLIDQNGKIYTVSSLFTKNFLSSPHAASFYEASIPPLLSTIDNDTVAPSKINWNYKNHENKFVPITSQASESAFNTYDITGAIGLRFAQNPDQCLVSVYDQNRLVYEGALQDLSSLAVSSQSNLSVRINATWKQKETNAFYGSAQYEFFVRIRNRSAFSISADTVYPGEWILLTATNISNPSRIKFSADWCPEPVFYQSGSTVHTLLPIPEDTTATSLQFEISHGASAQTFRIALLPTNKIPLSLSHSAFTNQQLLVAATLKNYTLQSQAIPINPNATPLFRGAFLNPTKEGFTVGYHHGDTVLMEDSSTLKLLGTEFLATSEAPQAVSVWNHGVVIQVGSSSSLGNFAVVDHGCGLRTWYCHLSRLEVSQGDALQKGQTVGFTGVSGISTGNGFLILCTINQSILDPSFIMEKTIEY